MGHRSIRVRILAAFVLAFVAMASTIGYSISELRSIGKELDAVNAGFLPMAKVAVELGALMRQLDRDPGFFENPSDLDRIVLRAQEELEARTRCKMKLKVHVF